MYDTRSKEINSSLIYNLLFLKYLECYKEMSRALQSAKPLNCSIVIARLEHSGQMYLEGQVPCLCSLIGGDTWVFSS